MLTTKSFSLGDVIWEDVSVHKAEQSGAQSQDKRVEQGKDSSPSPPRKKETQVCRAEMRRADCGHA